MSSAREEMSEAFVSVRKKERLPRLSFGKRPKETWLGKRDADRSEEWASLEVLNSGLLKRNAAGATRSMLCDE